MTKYEQLTLDLKKSLDESAFAESTEDGGTCNFDSPALYLPRWNRKQVEDAIQNAGLRAFLWNCYGTNYWVIATPSSGQGNRRMRRAEAMQKSLKANGYETTMYYQMD